MTVRLWAPLPHRVTLVTPDRRIGLERADNGWWEADVELEAGTDYGFALDDETQALPDPRGRRLPDGVHGLTRVFDPAEHRWQDGSWTGRQLAGGLIYELHVGTFTPQGTL